MSKGVACAICQRGGLCSLQAEKLKARQVAELGGRIKVTVV